MIDNFQFRKEANEIKMKNRKKKLKIVYTILNIIFADAKSTIERIVSLFSALFWTWLEFSFFKFFFTYAFGFAGYITGGSYKYSYDMMINNKDFINTICLVVIVLIFITRIGLYKKKEIKEK